MAKYIPEHMAKYIPGPGAPKSNADLKKNMNLLGQVARILKSGPEGLGLQIQAFE